MLAETFDEIIEDVKWKARADARAEAQKDLLIKLIKGGMPLEQLSQTLDIPNSDLKALKSIYVDGK